MPPKSSSKKNTVASWYHCDTCNVHITSKARDTHDQVCPIRENTTETSAGLPLEYIRDGVLLTHEFMRRSFEIEELNEVPGKFLNNIIYISEGAIRMAGFHIGQEVQVQPTTTDIPMVRTIWPIPEKFLTTVFVTGEDYDTNWEQFKGCMFRIQKLPKGSVNIARVVELDIQSHEDDEPLNELQLKDVARLLKLEMKELLYSEGSVIRFSFYNRKLVLKVTAWERLIENPNKSNVELERAFESLSLNKDRQLDGFFRVAPITHLDVTFNKNDYKNDEFEGGGGEYEITVNDIGGLDDQLRSIEESMNLVLGFVKAPKDIKLPRTILLFGANGCGKTLVCQAMSTIARKASKSVQILKVNTSELFSKFLGETEKNLMVYFDKAFSHYPQPTLIIIEDVHNLSPKEETNDISKRVSVAFAGMLDDLSNRLEGRRTFLIATTSEIDSINPSVRRCGRLDTEIEISPPTPKERAAILSCTLHKVDHELDTTQINEIAQITHGFVGADLVNLLSHAILASQKNGKTIINVNDVLNALTQVKPSAMREVLIENPNVRWSDIGGQSALRLQLKQAIEWPLLFPEKFKRLGIKPPRGILMYGPPGCSKTMIAKALATESQVNFLSIKGPELFSMWVGESERAVREVFRKARQVAPAIVFFDEIDAIGGERSENSGTGGGSSVQERVLTQLLTELDGVEVLQNVTIVAATNRPDMIDKALLRPGRIDRIVYVGLPDTEARHEIFRIKLSAVPLSKDVELDQLVQRTDGYTGAEIQAVCHEAALKTLEESLEAEHVSWKHFEYALSTVQPRTSPDLLRLYKDYSAKH